MFWLLRNLVVDGEPAFFGGDLNEGFWPRVKDMAEIKWGCFLKVVAIS
jgi:hypothetical protein